MARTASEQKPPGDRHGDLGVVQVAHLYATRGDAHVDWQQFSWQSHRQRPSRDCLHWCVQPGVLDALALSLLERVRQMRANTTARTGKLRPATRDA